MIIFLSSWITLISSSFIPEEVKFLAIKFAFVSCVLPDNISSPIIKIPAVKRLIRYIIYNFPVI